MPLFERKAVLTIMLDNFAFAAKKKSKDLSKTHSEHRALLNGPRDSIVCFPFFIAAIRPSHGRLLDGCVGFHSSSNAIYISLMQIVIRARLNIFPKNVCPEI